MSEEREPFGREEKTARRAEPNFAPPQLGVLIEESKSMKERVNEPVFESWWPKFLSVSFSILTTESMSLKCIWNKLKISSIQRILAAKHKRSEIMLFQ